MMDIDLIDDITLRAVIEDLCPRLAPMGELVLVSDAKVSRVYARALLPPDLKQLALNHWPNVLVQDRESGWLFTIDVAALRGHLTASRCRILSRFLGANNCVVMMNAFGSRREYNLDAYRPWFTSAWFADEPNRILHFGSSLDWHRQDLGREPRLRILVNPHVNKQGTPYISTSSAGSAEFAYEVEIGADC